MIELRHLLYFKRVAETEHLTKAASDLFISQSHLSHVIIELETELGVRLFDRVGRGVCLNPCGTEFYRDVVRLLYEYEDAKKKAQEIYLRQKTQLTIVTNISSYMPGLLRHNKQVSPGLNIRQYSLKRRRILRTLLNGDATFAICSPMLDESPELESLLLHTEHGVIVYPEGHWLEGCASSSLLALKDESFVSVAQGYGTRDTQDLYLKEAGISVNNTVETSDTSAVYAFVREGLGIAIAPKTMTLMDPYFSKRYVQLDEDPHATIGLTWRRDHYLSEAARTFFETTRTYFQELSTFL